MSGTREETIASLRRDTYALASADGRVPGTPGHDRARAFVEARFADLGLATVDGLDGYRHDFATRRGITASNLVGVVPGADRALRPLLVGAHYDSVLTGPCADDNAAGVAVILEVASRLVDAPLQRDVLVVSFDTEEPPFFLGPDMGSHRLLREVLTDSVHLAVVLDLVGHPVVIPGMAVDPDLVFVTGAESHAALPGLLGGLDLPVAATAQRRVGDFSDYAAFRQAGAPYLFFSCGEWEHYHRHSDHPDLMDYRKMARLVDDLEHVLQRADDVVTAYHEPKDCTSFEVESMERALGPEVLTAAARALGRGGYTTAEDLDAIVIGLRSLLL